MSQENELESEIKVIADGLEQDECFCHAPYWCETESKLCTDCAIIQIKKVFQDAGYRLIPEPSQDKVQKIKDICRSMITASHYNNLEDDMFESYIKEICQLFVIPELSLLTDEKIREAMKAAIDEGQLYGDDGEPLPEKAVAQAQRASCEKQYRERLREIKKELEKRCPHRTFTNAPLYCPKCWESFWEGLGI